MGYLTCGKILRVDLTTGKITTEPTEAYQSLFFGGKGINTQILYDEVGPEVKPLDPENVIAIGTGPLIGTAAPGTGKIDISSKSPETNILGSSAMGGYWGPELKFAGYDHLLITGKASKPVYLAIENDEVAILEAEHLWGRDTYVTQELIKKELKDPEYQVLCIGPSGENQIVYSTVQHSSGSCASRTGMGAVMGSKKLKAIAVRGTKGVQIAEPGKFLELAARMNQAIRENPLYPGMSTTGVVLWCGSYAKMEFSQINNGQNFVANSNPFPGFFKTPVKRYGCFGCPVHCQEVWNIDGVSGVGMHCAPYNEVTLRIGNYDQKAAIALHRECQLNGVESISFHAIVSWLMELRQRGIITDKDTDGIPMEWGNTQSAIKLLGKIVKREGIGEILANGIVPAAQLIGRGSEYYAQHTKGLGHHALNLRAFIGHGLAAATGPRGDYVRSGPDLESSSFMIHHMGLDKEEEQSLAEYYDEVIGEITKAKAGNSPTTYEGKPELVAFAADQNNACDQTTVCKWLTPFYEMPLSIDVQAEFLTYGWGREVTREEVLTAGRRLETLVRAYNCREGMTRQEDDLPKRFFDEAIPKGMFKGFKLDRDQFENMKSEYYTIRGWDVKTGVPTRATLEKYGMASVAADLLKKGVIPQTADTDMETVKSPVANA